MVILLIIILAAIVVSSASVKDSERVSMMHCPKCNFNNEVYAQSNSSKYTRHICLKCGSYYYKEVIGNK